VNTETVTTVVAVLAGMASSAATFMALRHIRRREAGAPKHGVPDGLHE
jgi:hypothetical protein